MAAIDRAAIREHLWPGINFFFGDEYNDYSPEWAELFDVRKSEKAYEETVARKLFGLAAEKEPGTGITFDEASDVYTSRYVNQTYGIGYIITREAVEDNQYGSMVEEHTRALKRSMMHTKEIRGVSVLNNGFNTAFAGGDGKPLFSATHPLAGGGTFSNLGTAADLSEAAVEAAVTQIGVWVDERGLLINAQVEKLIVANGGQFQATRILMSEGRTATELNDINAVKRQNDVPQGFRVNHRLTDPDAWFLRTDVPYGLICFNRRPLRVEEGEGFDNQVLKVIATERYCFGWSDPRGYYGNTGA